MSASFAAQEPGLFSTVRDGALEAVDRALSVAGTRARQLNSFSQSLLFYAVQRQDQALEVCRLLVDDYGVSAELVDKRGQTALHFLATSENVDCVEFLLEKRCFIDHVDALLHQTPLFYAAHRSSAAMVREMMRSRADPAFKDRNGKTSLCWAARADTARELARHSSVNGGVCDNKQAVSLAVEWHKQNKRPTIAKYLGACAEAWSLRGCLSWVARQDGNEVSAYTTCLARARDVQQLCALEDEFIADHRDILPIDSELDLFEQIGLNPDARVRQETIKSISHAGSQSGPVKHFTVTCQYMPEGQNEKCTGTARARSYETVGYVYFRVCQGPREEDEDSDEEAAAAPPLPVQKPTTRSNKEKAAAAVGHIVISHIKVSRRHQKRGVATLLLASALQLAEAKCPTFKCRDLHLSVAERNRVAAGLYCKLGFAAKVTGKQTGWISMRMHVEGTLGQTRAKWLRMVWDRDAPRDFHPTWWAANGGLADSRMAVGGLPIAIANTANVSVVSAEPSDVPQPGSRKRKLSSSNSAVSEASTSAGSAASSSQASAWSIFSGAA